MNCFQKSDTSEPFASYYSSRQKESVVKSRTELLPLLPNKITEPATVLHAMKIGKSVTEMLNSSQTLVFAGDQPVYALGKEIQWKYPDIFNKTYWLMGPLHIE